MKKVFILLIILAFIVGRAMWIEENSPDAWSTVWKNYKDTESIGTLLSDGFDVLRGEPVKRVAMSVREMNRVIYKWVDDYGVTQMSYQKPVGVQNVQEVRLGDLDYQVEKSLTEEQKKKLLEGNN